MSTSSNKLKTGVKMGWERRERYRRWWKTDYVKDCVCVIELWVIELCVKELRESAACDKERLCV